MNSRNALKVTRRLALAAALGVALAACSARQTPEELLQQATAAMEAKDLSSAAIQLKNALQINPDFAAARLALGTVSYRMRDMASAEKELNRALELGASKDEAVPLLARLLAETGQFQLITTRFSTTRLDQPGSQAILDAALGYADLAARNTEAAGRHFDSAIAVLPEEPFVVVGKARQLAYANRFGDARALLKPLLVDNPANAEAWFLDGEMLKLEGSSEQSIAAYRKVASLRPDLVAARRLVVSALIEARRYDDARQELDALRKATPQALEVDYLNAYLLASTQKYEEARASVDKVLSKSPDNLPALSLAALVSFELQAYAQAEQYAEKVIARGADSLLMRKVLIGSYLRTGRVAKAQQSLAPVLKANPTHPEVLALAGQVQLASGESEAALKSFEGSLRGRPDDVNALSQVGLVRLANGDYDGGVKALESAASRDTEARADLMLVLAHLRNSKPDAAIEALNALARKRPEDPIAANLRGSAYLMKRDMPAARAAFEQALKLQPTYFPAVSNLARLDVAEGKVDAAGKRFERVLEQDADHLDALLALAGLKAQKPEGVADAERLLERAVKAHPKALQPRAALVQLARLRGDRDKAIAAAQDAVNAMPGDARMLELLANLQAEAGKPDQVEATLRKAVEAAPNDANLLSQLAVALTNAGKWGEAEQIVRKAIQLQPDAPNFMVQLAAVHVGRKSFADAMQVATDIQKKFPKRSVGWMVAGDVQLASGQRSAALSSFRQAYALEPSAGVLIRLLSVLDLDGQKAEIVRLADAWQQKNPKDVAVQIHLADTDLVRGHYEAAVARYQKINALAPDNVLVLNNLAWGLMKLNNPSALSYAERAYRRAGNNPAVLDTYGQVLISADKKAEGLAMLRRAVEKAPQANDVRLNLARALVQGGLKDEARPHLEKLAALGRNYPGSAEAAALLKSL
ncbi:XrtA/PEP-CTERM system TPR-repeat protein PrsT [Methyloversatilis thermotolerans]|uniref:XrtA/PEP-CTERM system TPR-repeat protein PrsT n=1 Tax=Methyloversatilis thermotolerans TaxID=1346290 RepID=UPI00036D187B|nr:XrtA/PEP-CTERM system TPR-repeat protein PrsT [Methyloversatilis thermotolerans]